MYNILLLTDMTHALFLSKSLGPYKVANSLRKSGFDVQVINHLHIFSIEEIKKLLAKFINENTLFVGVNPFFYQNCENVKIQISDGKPHEQNGKVLGPKEIGSILPHGAKYNQEIRDFIQSCNANTKLVLGGPDAQDAAYIRDFDYTILGYADDSVVNLANHLAYGTALQNHRRSINRSIIIDDSRAENYNFIATPMSYEQKDCILPGETLVTEISRGCVFQCKFCSYPLNGKNKNDHIKLREVLLKEFLENFENHQITRYIFSDDTFNDSLDKVKMMRDISKLLPFQLEYWAYIRLDLLAAHPECIDWLYESGCRSCSFGIESMNPESSKIIGKGGSRSKLKSTLRHIRSAYGDDINLHGTFIFGLPRESIESMTRTSNELLEGEIPLHSWAIFPLLISRNKKIFSSEIDMYSDRFGYKEIDRDRIADLLSQYEVPTDIVAQNNIMPWENQHTNFFECWQLTKRSLDAKENKSGCISGLDSFFAAGLGLDLKQTLNRTYQNMGWHHIETCKIQRSQQYRDLLSNLVT